MVFMQNRFELQGKHNVATVFTDQVDDVTIGQIIELCNQEFTQNAKIRIMPDCHAGKGCVIGTTMTIQDKIVPNLVGVDIGCGMFVQFINIDPSTINYDQVDHVIRNFVPHGQNAHDSNKRHTLHHLIKSSPLFQSLHAPIDYNRAYDNVGTLGGGNHFIELNLINDTTIALVIHSGSRNVGAQVAKYHQDKAYDELTDNLAERKELIKTLKAQGRERDIESALKSIRKPHINKELAYLTGKSFDAYMHDMNIAQKYAEINRRAMAESIMKQLNWESIDSFDTIHNYIDFDTMILRKGAISAQKDERVIIPINMRDGSIIATGKGHPDWNYSGPHGAGRVLSRSKAKEQVDYQAFKDSMTDVWSTSVSKSTLDESPMAYKSIHAITDNVQDTLDIKKIIKPLYNFKSSN